MIDDRTQARFHLPALFGFGLLLALGGCALNPATGGPDLVMMSEKKEIALGRKMHPEVLKAFPRYEDEELQAYVQSLGERLAKTSHRSDLEYHFTVVEDDAVNAFALPGGYIYVSRGLIAHMNSEAELAAVIGHEIGHVTGRHAVRQQSRAKLLNTLGSAVGVVSGVPIAGGAASIAGGALVRGYGRSLELEADELGAEYLAKAGYPTEAMISVIDILKQQERFEIDRARIERREARVSHGFFSTHPDNDKRLEEIVRAAEKLGPGTPDADNADVFYSHLEGLRYGDRGWGGVVRNGRHYNLPYRITFKVPQGWRTVGKDDRLLAISPQGEAAMQVSAQPIGSMRTPRYFMVRQLGLDLREGREMTVAGMPAYIAIAERAESPFGRRPVRYAVIFDHSNGFAYVFSGAGENDARSVAADNEFIPAIFSLDKLDNRDAADAKPLAVKVVRAEPGMTFESLAADSPMSAYAEQQLRLLNNRYPDGEPEPGEPVKIVD
ncbi:MAG TPA: M48 family metalloprotease [Gammaproteobacteria bacterium]|nr:M48 family metalloprotease [Gammaproteobacteria bacterium]